VKWNSRFRPKRDVQYSFDRADAYYVETGGDVVYTQRIGGPFDVQVRVARQQLAFDISQPGSNRSENVNGYHAGLGYSLENRSRMGLTYEHTERGGSTFADRPYSRRRLFASFTYEFWK
jgi:hypothetical protein